MTHDAYSTKRVTVWPEQKVTPDGNQALDGYAIKYQDGYRSWCPKDVYERDYQPITAMSFGHAIHALKAGHAVARKGWNGKGMFIYYVDAASYPAQTLVAMRHFGVKVPYQAYIAMKTAQGNVVPWLASQTDMLSDDWEIVYGT